MNPTDDEIVAGLREIDESEEIDVTEWEGTFLDSIKKPPRR